MIDDTKMAVPRISYFLSAMYLIAHVLTKQVYFSFMDEHRFYAFHRKMYSFGCHCMSPVPLHVNEAPAHLDGPMIPLFAILVGSEKQMNTSFKVLLRRHSYYNYFRNMMCYDQLWYTIWLTSILHSNQMTLISYHCSSNMNRFLYEHVAHG